MSLKFLQKVPGKIRKYSWMGNWNREMLNNEESREPETCWLPETELVLSCCAQALHKISKLFMWVNDGFYFLANQKALLIVCSAASFLHFQQWIWAPQPVMTQLVIYRLMYLKFWGFVWIREKHKISVGGEHIGAETLTLFHFLNRILALFKYKGQEGLLLLIIFTRAVFEKHNLEGSSPSGRTCRA